MKSFALATIFCLVCIVTCEAQWNKSKIGFVSSLNLCPYVSNNADFYQHARLGFSLGSFIRTKISDRTSLDLGVSYMTKSYSLNSPNEDGKIIFKYTFLDVPLEFNYKMNQNENFDFYLSGGLVNSFGLSKETRSTFHSHEGERSLGGAYQLRAKGGLGFMFKTTGKASFGIEPQLGYTVLQGEKWSNESKSMYFGLEFFILMN